MAFTIEQYEALKKSISRGTHSISYSDKNVTYRSLEEMMRVLGMMEDELFPERRPRRRRLASIDRGYFPIDN